jgi:hypothetical protein
MGRFTLSRTIMGFLLDHPIDFPVLLDPGAIIAFPDETFGLTAGARSPIEWSVSGSGMIRPCRCGCWHYRRTDITNNKLAKLRRNNLMARAAGACTEQISP